MPEEKIDDLKKLSPKDRIKKLKELQEKDKAEIVKAQKMLTEAEDESDIEEELSRMPIPQLKAVDIDELFSPEEKELFRAKRFTEPKTAKKAEKPKQKGELEEIASQARRLSEEEEKQHIDYVNQLRQKPVEQLYGRAKELYSQFKEQGEYLTKQQLNEFGSIEYANRKKLEDIEAGRYTEVNQEVVREMVMIEKIKHIFGGYRR